MRDDAENRVAVVRVERDIAQAVGRAFELGDLPVLERGSLVAIKVNLCQFRTFETGATADPRVVEAAVQHLRSLAHGLDIVIVESDATSARANLLFKWLGFSNLSQRLGIRTSNLSEDKRVKVPLPKDCFLKELWMPKTLLDADCVISLAKMKTHGLTKITCSLKNHFGSIPYRNKIRWHPVLSEIIADANVAVRTHFSLVDGIIAMEGVNGPTMGVPRLMNLLVSGQDPVAVDSVCARIMGFDPNRIGHIQEAEKRGIGSQTCQIVGEELEQVRTKFDYSDFYHVVEQTIRKIRGSR